MDDQMIRNCLTTWVAFARSNRRFARMTRVFNPSSLAAAESMGMAKGIMLLARSIKGYQTQALYANRMRRAA